MDVIALAESAKGTGKDGYHAEFITLVNSYNQYIRLAVLVFIAK